MQNDKTETDRFGETYVAPQPRLHIHTTDSILSIQERYTVVSQQMGSVNK